MNSSLYIHIPFCRQKCDYCDFFSIPVCSGKAIPIPDCDYVTAVLNEINYYVKKYDITAWNTIYVGGGTPSQLSPGLLCKLIDGAKKSVKNAAVSEITVEMNPEDVTEELIFSAEQCGVTRISMGIQALDDKALQAINRRCSAALAINALELLKKHWKGRLSVDFIAGLPGQTLSSFEQQFKTIASYTQDHISLYTLTVEEGTPLYRKISSGQIKWNAQKADRMWIKGRNILEKMGYLQYEVSNFSRPGFESRHNQVYWNLENYIGAGSGASGTVYDGNGERWSNTTNIAEYKKFWLSNDEKSDKNVHKIRQLETLSPEIQEFEYVMMGLRMLKGISAQAYFDRFGKSLAEKIGAENEGLYWQWSRKKLTRTYKKNGQTYYSLNRRGIMLLNLFLESLL